MKKYLEILRKCPLFNGIGDDELLRMLSCLGAKIISYDKKSTIFPEGSRAENIGILLSGEAQSIQFDYDGNKSILNNIFPTEIFAEAFACAEIKALPIDIVASDRCEVMLIDCSHVLHTCSNNCGFHQALIFNLMKDLALKTISFHERIEVTSRRTTRDKLLTYLSIISKKTNQKSFEIPFNRQELADYLEVDRSGLSNEISKMRREGILESSKSFFKLL